MNSFPAMAIDIETRLPRLANVTGGLTGPCIKPIAIKLVWEAAKAVKIPIIGMGGIQTAADAIEFIMVINGRFVAFRHSATTWLSSFKSVPN